jgi:hypothetical protein
VVGYDVLVMEVGNGMQGRHTEFSLCKLSNIHMEIRADRKIILKLYGDML